MWGASTHLTTASASGFALNPRSLCLPCHARSCRVYCQMQLIPLSGAMRCTLRRIPALLVIKHRIMYFMMCEMLCGIWPQVKSMLDSCGFGEDSQAEADAQSMQNSTLRQAGSHVTGETICRLYVGGSPFAGQQRAALQLP